MISCFSSLKNTLESLHPKNRMELHSLYPGITLAFLTLHCHELTLTHPPLSHILEINYCHAGRIGWDMGCGHTLHLGAGDFDLHRMDRCPHSFLTLPNHFYHGIVLYLDLQILERNPPPLLGEIEDFPKLLLKKFCSAKPFSSFAGNDQTEPIFSGFYHQPAAFEQVYWKLKANEILLYLSKLEVRPDSQLSEHQSSQVALVREIHEQMLLHIDQRFTIDSLAKEYLINPTTLKTVFKAVYGSSIAAHIKEHRMKIAAKMLLETNNSLAKIAQAVGYESQSRFTAAFKDYFGILPKDYRKNHERLS